MRRLWLACLFILLGTTGAFAQSTAQDVRPGFITTAGCPSGQTSCFVPYSLTNPMPITGGGGGPVTQATTPWIDNVTQFGGSPVVTGTGTGGAGVPRVTVSNDSFPTTQPVSGIVTIAPTAATPTNRGGTLATGGTAQSLAAANASRKALVVQNPCGATESLFIATNGATATTTGTGDYAELTPCGTASLSFNGIVDQTAISVNAVTLGHAYFATEYQ